MQSGLVSVMMPAYNAERYIAQAIESMLTQRYTHWELIVVDDGSTDQTPEIVRQFTDPRIKMVHQANAGEAGARNTALKQMRGEFVAFLDADDAYLTPHLEVTIGYLATHPDRGAVYTDGYYCDQDGNRLQTLSSRRRGPFEGRLFEEIVRTSNVFGPPGCVVLRYDVIKRYRLNFDESLFYCNDWDFFTRYSDLADFGYVNKCTYLYRVHLSNISITLGLRKRASYIAKCRMKAVKMKNFGACSLEARSAVFYDLLVNLLRGSPDRQSEVAQWPEFKELPTEVQARLIRLVASKSLIDGGEQRQIREWIRRSRALNPGDRRGAMLYSIYNVSPLLCKLLLLVRTWGQPDPLRTPPFADLKRASSL